MGQVLEIKRMIMMIEGPRDTTPNNDVPRIMWLAIGMAAQHNLNTGQ